MDDWRRLAPTFPGRADVAIRPFAPYARELTGDMKSVAILALCEFAEAYDGDPAGFDEAADLWARTAVRRYLGTEIRLAKAGRVNPDIDDQDSGRRHVAYRRRQRKMMTEAQQARLRRNLLIAVARAVGFTERSLADTFGIARSRIAAIEDEVRAKYLGPYRLRAASDDDPADERPRDEADDAA